MTSDEFNVAHERRMAELSDRLSVGKSRIVRKPSRASKRHRIPIVCVETGQTYDSIIDCAKALGVGHANIRQSVKPGHACFGFHYETQRAAARRAKVTE